MPRKLQSKIHSDKSTSSSVWNAYKQQIIDLWNASQKKGDFNDHLIREYNRKIDSFNQNSDLFITPYNAGYRFIGSSLTSFPSIYAKINPDDPFCIIRFNNIIIDQSNYKLITTTSTNTTRIIYLDDLGCFVDSVNVSGGTGSVGFDGTNTYVDIVWNGSSSRIDIVFNTHPAD